MVERSNLDPIAEAQARVRLRYAKTKPVAPGPPTLGRLSKKITRKAITENIDVIKTENLYEFDGVKGFSLGQGQ